MRKVDINTYEVKKSVSNSQLSLEKDIWIDEVVMLKPKEENPESDDENVLLDHSSRYKKDSMIFILGKERKIIRYVTL